MRDLSSWAAGVIRSRAKRKPPMTLRRANTLRPAALKVSVDAPSGATSLSLTASTGKLVGSVVAGSQFTLSGLPSTTFTVLEDADTLTSGTLVIGISPALPVPVPATTPLTFTVPYSDVSYPALQRRVYDIDKKEVDEGESVRLLPFEPGKPAPRQNDRLNGIPIIRVEDVDGDGENLAYYRCTIDEGRV